MVVWLCCVVDDVGVVGIGVVVIVCVVVVVVGDVVVVVVSVFVVECFVVVVSFSGVVVGAGVRSSAKKKVRRNWSKFYFKQLEDTSTILYKIFS